MTSSELADRTGTHERYVREWLANQAASGYLDYDARTQRFTLPAEHQPVLADETSPVLLCGLYQIAQTLYADEPQITEAFKTGRGFGWHEHDDRLFAATERFFRPGYNANLVVELDPGARRRRSEAARRRDRRRRRLRPGHLDDRHGARRIRLRASTASTITKARSTPRAKRRNGRRRATACASTSRRATKFPGKDYDFIACFDCIHDMGDPVGAADAHPRGAEAGRHVHDGRAVRERRARRQSQSGRARVLRGIDHAVHAGIALARGRARRWARKPAKRGMRAIFDEAGFSRFRRATETPFNLVFEARP